MQVKWRCAVACLVFCLALGVGTWAQEDGPQGPPLSGLGPTAIAATDAQGRFFAEFTEPFPLGVSGQVNDAQGEPLAATEVTVVLEPRPGIPVILGIGHIGAIWLAVGGTEPVRIAGFSIGSGRAGWAGTFLEVGTVAFSERETCTPCTYRFRIRMDDKTSLSFHHEHCGPDGTWGPPVMGSATKLDALPEKADKACTWIVVATSEARRVIYSFYHSDGTTWQSKGAVEIAVVAVRPAACKICTYVQVKPSEGLFITYHCDPTGKWVQIGRWEILPEPPSGPPVIIIP